MADIMPMPNKYRRVIQRKIMELKEYEKWYNMAWFAICELIYLHSKGK